MRRAGQRQVQTGATEGVAHRARSAAALFHSQVNDEKVAVPYNPNEHLRVMLRAQRLLLVTDFEMVLDFDGKHSAGNRQGHRLQKALSVPGVLTHTCNPSPQEPRQEGLPC